MEEYQRRWKESIDDPYQFWGQIAKEFHWKKEPTKEDFVNYNFNVNDGPIKVHTSTYKYLHTSIANLVSVICTFKKKSNVQKFNPIFTECAFPKLMKKSVCI